MIVTKLISLPHINKKSREIISISRCTDLIRYNPHMIVSLSHVNHRLDEVLAVLSEYPRDSHNEEPVRSFGNSELSFKLGLTVIVDRRVILAVRRPWLVALAVENIVCADVEYLRAHGSGSLGPIRRCI